MALAAMQAGAADWLNKDTGLGGLDLGHLDRELRARLRLWGSAHRAHAPPPAPTPLSSSSAYHGRRAGLLAPDILELPYRQLVSEPCAALETVYAHAGVAWGAPTEALHAQQARDMRAHAVNAFAPLPEALRALLRGRWGPYYDAFGYR